jgi:hypothetical protein
MVIVSVTDVSILVKKEVILQTLAYRVKSKTPADV